MQIQNKNSNNNINFPLSLFGGVSILFNKPYKAESIDTAKAHEAYEKALNDYPDLACTPIPGHVIFSTESDLVFDLRDILESLLLDCAIKFAPNNLIEGSFVFYFLIGFSLFLIGFFGLILIRTNIISLLLSVELMLLGLSFCFIVVCTDQPVNYLYDLKQIHEPGGFLVALTFLGLAAAESALGLALIVLVFKQYKNLNVNNFGLLRG